MKKIITMFCLLFPLFLAAQASADIEQELRYRKYATAETKSRALIATQPVNAAHWYWLSQTLLQKKDSAAVAGLMNSLPQDIVRDPWYQVVRGAILLNNNNQQEARGLFDEAISATRGKNVEILAAVARLNIHSSYGDKQYAIELIDKAIRRDRDNPSLYTLKGDAYFRLKNGGEAYRAFTEAARLKNNYAPAMYELGKIFATQNNEPLYLQYFNATVQADPSFAPAWHQLFFHYYKTEPAKALQYFRRYLEVADVEQEDRYQLVDLLFLAKRYDSAIIEAKTLLAETDAGNRLNKLLGYTYSAINRQDSALLYMNRYFSNGADTSFLVKDYEMMASIYDSLGMKDSVAVWYTRLLPLLHDEVAKRSYYRKLAEFYGEQKDHHNQALWLGNYYRDNSKATNVDLFNWGLALYQAGLFVKSDSVFSFYADKYPDQVFGYYWQARSKAAIDSTMEDGLAVPVYAKLIDLAEKDTSSATNRRYLVEAYGYIAAYTANEEKNYQSAIEYFQKLLALDPLNTDAKRYIGILERTVKANSHTDTDEGSK